MAVKTEAQLLPAPDPSAPQPWTSLVSSLRRLGGSGPPPRARRRGELRGAAGLGRARKQRTDRGQSNRSDRPDPRLQGKTRITSEGGLVKTTRPGLT